MKKSIFIIALAALLTACTPAEDIKVTTDGPYAAVLQASGDVVLEKDNASALALSLNWSDNNNIATVGSAVAPANATVNTLQFSTSEDFADVVEYLCDKGSTAAQFTVETLNTICIKAGLDGGSAQPLYVRLASSLGANMAPVYSNTVLVNVTPFTVDFSLGHILNSAHEDTGATLKRTSDGVYSGFMGASSWFNWFLQEGDGTEWGNLGQDGRQFYISSDDSKWNMWFPEPSGCYYTVVDTKKGEWSALNIPALTLAGDLSGEMVYDRAANSWSYTWNAASAGTVNVTVSGTGRQYDTTTGDSSFNESTVGFGGSASAVIFGSSASAISVAVGLAGEVSLVLNLTDMTLSVVAGGAGPVEVPGLLYAVGVNDGWTDAGWDFENYLVLYDADNLAYAGACNINSKWGYRFYTEKDNWSGYYGLESGDALSGALVAEVENNIPAPEVGMYLMQVSLSAKTYTNTAISAVYIAGVGRDSGWELLEMTPANEAGVYSLPVAVEGSTPWGFKIYINGWDYWFGGSEGLLRFGADGCPLDDSYIGSTCLFTVDICKGTYSIVKQ